MARLFNAYLIVDWSAASKRTTGADSIWIGLLKRDVRFRLAFESHNPATRKEAEALIGQILDDRAKRRERTLAGFDFPLGFPRGLAAALGLAGEAPWRAVWDQLDRMVKDKADNTNNRFGVASEINRRLTGGPFPFWGCPPRDTLTTLQPKKLRAHGPGDLPEFRHTELEPAAKGASPVWKLGYQGSVGGQAIMGIPAVRRLAEARGDRLRAWPFQTGWKALTEADLAGVEVVVAEVYPSILKAAQVHGEVRDLTQVRALAEHFARLDEAGKLAALFAPAKGTAADVVIDAEREEGWILGAS
ncbi:MAG: cobalamin biosynthesis protein CbiG [Pseudomonadota bacterium]